MDNDGKMQGNIGTNIKNILVIGTGGIGCELAKLLCLSHPSRITLIDYDNIELSNLNRQFMFTNKDITKPKSEVLHTRMKYMKDWDINYIVDTVANYDILFFKQFDVVYNCLDNNEARSYVNLRCFLAQTKLIDGGSGGYLGQTCLFDYTKECFECLPKALQQVYSVCTIKSIPTKFEHCVEYIRTLVMEEKIDYVTLADMTRDALYSQFIATNIFVRDTSTTNDKQKKIDKDIDLVIQSLHKLRNNSIDSMTASKNISVSDSYVESDTNNSMINSNTDVNNSEGNERSAMTENTVYNKLTENSICDKTANSKYDNTEELEPSTILEKLVYKLSCIRARSANVKVISYMAFQTIYHNIIPSLCTTNSNVASLMLMSEKRNKNYFLTLSKRQFIELQIGEKNKQCIVCSKRWVIMNYKKDAIVRDLFRFMSKTFGISCKYVITSLNAIYSTFSIDQKTRIDIQDNSTCTLGYNKDEMLMIYFLRSNHTFEVCNL